MVTSWRNWKPFPDPQAGGHVDAPVGPGVFEVRHTGTGEQIAFAASSNVASCLTTLIPPPMSRLRSIFARERITYQVADLEYRTCGATTIGEARAVTYRLNGRRRTFLQRRQAVGWS